MKYSIFNTCLSINDRHTLFYNAFSGKFVVVKNSLVDLHTQSINTLRSDNPNLYERLKDAGLIIEDSINEPELLREFIMKADNNYDEFILHINPTLDCNFNCWYCYENHVPKSKMGLAVLDATKAYINSILSNPQIKSLEIGFFGGEPLLYFNSVAKILVSHAAKRCINLDKRFHVHFTSNGALLTDNIVNFLSQYPCGFQITLDGGRSFHDKTRYYKNRKGSYDSIVKNIHRLVNVNIDVIVRVNYTKENIDSINSILESFRDINVNRRKFLKFDFQRVWQDRKKNSDQTEQKIALIRKTFRNEGYLVLANYIPHDVRNSCYGDKINHALINYNGDVFGCTARDFTKENRIGRLQASGNIIFNNDIVAKRNNSKLSKAICQTCRIAPLCGGGCKQKALESPASEECTMGYTEEDMT